MTKTWPNKDPDDTLDYAIDWSSWLADGETISSSDWIVPAGLTEDSATNTTTSATIWLSGGTARTTYSVTNRIVTSAGRQRDQTVRLTVVEL